MHLPIYTGTDASTIGLTFLHPPVRGHRGVVFRYWEWLKISADSGADGTKEHARREDEHKRDVDTPEMVGVENGEEG
jgi:hypothetical protein